MSLELFGEVTTAPLTLLTSAHSTLFTHTRLAHFSRNGACARSMPDDRDRLGDAEMSARGERTADGDRRRAVLRNRERAHCHGALNILMMEFFVRVSGTRTITAQELFAT